MEKDSSVRGVIIASGLKKDIFTAGHVWLCARFCVVHAVLTAYIFRVRRNDITELYSKATTQERYTRFWHAQTTCLVRGHLPRAALVDSVL